MTKRREFLKLAGTALGGALIGATPLIDTACKESEPTGPSKNVSVNIQFYNHTQGPLTERQYQGISGDLFIINAGQLGFSGVDPLRIAVRKGGSGIELGRCIKFSDKGEVRLKYPANNETWEAYLMNISNNANYNLLDYWYDVGVLFGRLRFGRHPRCQREDLDGYTGPEEPILEAIRQVNESLDYPWKRYGSLTMVPDLADFSIGYESCNGFEGTVSSKGIAGIHAGVNPDLCQTYQCKLREFTGNIFSVVNWCDMERQNNRQDPGTIRHYVSDQGTGIINPAGKDLFAYSFVKDENS